MRILITGGTGLIGRRLCAFLTAQGHTLTVLSRQHAGMVKALCGANVIPMRVLEEYRADTVFDAVINLAGEPIADRRWTASRQQVLRNSRIALTATLLRRIADAHHKPDVFLSGSAIGYYGDRGDDWQDESASAGQDFGALLCAEWEAAALPAEAMGIRLCLLRTGLVLDAAGGVLQKMRLPFLLGLGMQIGDGRQWMSWIHIDDYIALLYSLLIDANAAGRFNMVAPNPVQNAGWTAALAHQLHRPAWLKMPAAVLRLMLGERAFLLTGGQRVRPAQALARGFVFRYPELAAALEHLWHVPD